MKPTSGFGQSMAYIASVLFAAFLLGGCANEVDDTPNLLPTEADVAKVCESGGAFCDCAVPGRIYRFTSLELGSLAGVENHAITRLLNPLWAGDIGRKEINIFIEIIETQGSEVTMRLVNGLRSSGPDVPFENATNCSKEETGISFIAVPSPEGGFENSAPAGFNITSGTPAEPKLCAAGVTPLNSILVRDIELRAAFNDDCTKIINGVVPTASILKEALNNTCMCRKIGGTAEDCGQPMTGFVNEDGSCRSCNENFQNLGNLMKSLNGGDELPSECPVGDGQPGICVSGSFEAELIPDAPPACPE